MEAAQATEAHPIRVVLVDDHPALLAGVRDFLEDDGITVAASTGRGAEALDLIGSLHPDVLVLDLRLPDLDGLEVARQVRAVHPGVAVLILTGWDDPAATEDLVRLGVRGYLSKGQSSEEIVAAVRVAARGGTLLGSLAAWPTNPLDTSRLTAREREVLRLLMMGCRNTDMATELGVAIDTVEYHMRNLLEKLGALSRWELRARARRGTSPAPSQRLPARLLPPRGHRPRRQELAATRVAPAADRLRRHPPTENP